MAEQEKCALCGKPQHEGYTVERGLTPALCKHVPPGFVWLDRKYDKGPAGALVELKKDVA
jgi:hypothetical protein